jgi:hypothetical protein
MTGAVVQFRPTFGGFKGSGAVVFFAHRQVTGLYSTSLTTAASTVNKNKKPSSLHPIGYINGDRSKPVLIDPVWSKYLGLEIGGRKLGGPAFPTLPEVASFVTQQQVDAQLAAAQDQWMSSLAQTMAALREVVVTATLAGADQVPPVVLARQETNPQPISPYFYDNTASSGGSGGDGGGGGDGGE